MASAGDLLRRALSRGEQLRRERRDARFEPRLRPGGGPALLLSPHMDDAILDCWSELIADPPPRVVDVFAGVPPAGVPVPLWDRITGAHDSSTRVRERLEEDERALGRAGARALRLPLLDAQYRGRGRPLAAADVDRALSASRPGTSDRVLAPAGIGGHPDHLLVRRYARLLLRHGFAVTLYAELPYCVLHGWPGWVDGRADDPHRDVDAFWGSFLAGVPELGGLRSARVVRLGDESAAAKLAALRSYATQMPALSYGGHDLLADPEIHRYEVFWDLDG